MPTNALEIRLLALRRSGSHAVVQWLLAQLPGRGVFLNSCKPGENPYACCYRGDSVTRPQDLDLDRERDLGPTPKDFLLYNYEDRELPAVFSDAFEAEHDRWLGTSGRRFDLLVLRDPWNNLASLLRWARGTVYPIALDSVAKAARLWKTYAREILRERVHPNRTPVLFNRWVTDRGYRAELAGRLGVPFTDAGRDEVAPWGPTTWGDSFDGLAYDGRAGEMPVLERWRWCADDPFYRGLFDPEMMELSERIFGPLPPFLETGA